MSAEAVKTLKNHAMLLLVSTSLIVWYMHVREIDIPKKKARAELHSAIINGSAPSPYRHRILLPFVAEALGNTVGKVASPSRSLLFAYAFLEAISITALILVLYSYLCLFFDSLIAILGALFANLSLVVALRDHYFQPWSPVNALAFALAAIFIYKNKFMPLCLTIVVAAFNRETSIVIALMYLFASSEEVANRRRIFSFLLLLILWGGVFILVMAIQGSAAHLYALSDILGKNLVPRNLLYTLFNLSLFMGFFWVFIIKGYVKSPLFVKKLALMIPFYLLPVMAFGVWKEVRLLMPLYPVLLPMGLSYIFPSKEGRTLDKP